MKYQRKAIIALAIGALVLSSVFLMLSAQAPQWWIERDVTDSSATPNDYAPVNQGQLKHLAAQAYEELLENLPGGPGADLQGVTSAWRMTSGNDYLPVNLGQVKNLAQPFYDRLIAAGFTADYPWESSINPAADFALANIGQVKNLFSFDITFSSDSDPLPDWWRLHHFGTLEVSSGDPAPADQTLTLGEAYRLGRDPNAASAPDTPDSGAGLVALEVYTNLR